MEKEFGKLSLSQVKELAHILLELKKLRSQLTVGARNDPQGYLKNVPEDFSWSELYSEPLNEMILLLLLLGGMSGAIRHAVNTKDPQQYILDTFRSIEPQIQDFGNGKEYSEYTFLAIFFALMKSLESIEIYGCSLNRLMQRVRQGDEQSLFDIIRLDHSAVGNPDIMRCISIAEFQDDKKFFARLRNALKHRPLKHTAIYGPIRYILTTFHELGVLGKLSTEDFYQLFCVELKLYPTASKDPARSLQRLIDRWAKVNATSNDDFMSSSSGDKY